MHGIGDHGLIDPVEGVNASIALHMYGGGNYLMARIGEALAAGTSMGTWWLMSFALKILGWGESSVRFFSALAGLVMILAAALANASKPDMSSRRSWLAASICAGTTLCFTVSQLASSHALYSCFTALAFLGIVRSKESRDWLMLSHFAIAFAFIFHGPSGFFMPMLAVGIYCALTQDHELLKDFFTWPAGIIINLLISGCYFSLLISYSPQTVYFMFFENQSYTFGGIWGTIIFAFVGFAPFHGFFLQAIYEAVPKKFPVQKSSELFMLVWACVFFIAGLCSKDILTMAASVPALSSLLGRRLDRWFRGRMNSLRYAVMFNILILVPVFFVLLPLTSRHFPVMSESLLSLVPYEITIGLFIFASWYYTKTKQITKWARNVPAAALICLMPAAGVFNLTANVYSVREIGLSLRGLVKGREAIIQDGLDFPSIYFYTLRNSVLVDVPESGMTPGVNEKKFATNFSIIEQYWNRKSRVFLITPTYKNSVLPKNVYPVIESHKILLLSNQ